VTARGGPQTPQLPTNESAVLTAHEREVVRLAAEGLTNKEIGSRLFLSHRTVGAHLYRAFPKLGVTSRASLRDALTSMATLTVTSTAAPTVESTAALMATERRRGLTVPRRSRRGPAPSATLTPREQVVADLAAAGLTNKQIALRLQVSPRTVGAHLRQVFRKLGVPRRAAIRDCLAAVV
jgi:DNA-binding NarL/FixJ family response regulator